MDARRSQDRAARRRKRIRAAPMLRTRLRRRRLDGLLWNRDHGLGKRVRVVAALIQQTGWDLQLTAARTGTPADAPLLTVDTAMALVDQALARLGSMQGCTREEVQLAFQHLVNP